jgi:lipopolysaccharide export system protein LptA
VSSGTRTLSAAGLAAYLLAFLVACGLPLSAAAAADDRSPEAIEIDAENGIEWRRDEQLVLARGNARAVRGDMTVRAQVLSARYREGADGSDEIWQLEADGNVEIRSPGETVYAEHATYDLDRRVVNLRGDRVRLLTDGNEITADRMEYWTERRKLIARGNAEAVEGDRRLRAATLTAYLADPDSPAAQSSRLERVEAKDDVWVITPSEVLRGDAGSYDAGRDMATLTGDVRITRGPNQLNGCRGEVDLRAGISRLLACEDEGAGGTGGTGGDRVRGLVIPESRKK